MLGMLIPGAALKIIGIAAVGAFLGYVHHHGVSHGRALQKAETDRLIAAANTRIRDVAASHARDRAELSARLADAQKIIEEDLRAPRPVANQPERKPVRCAVTPRTKGALNDIMGAIKW